MKEQINTLTGFRALAAGMVLIGHFTSPAEPLWLIKYGWAGVNFFFALSGFLFVLLYYKPFAEGRQSIKDYAVKRLTRVYPLYIFLLLPEMLSSGRGYSFGDIVSHLTLTHSFFADYRFSVNPPSWTLCVELTFYALVPFLFHFIARASSAWHGKPHAQYAVQLLLMLFVYYALTHICRSFLEFRYDVLGDMGIDITGVWTTTIFGRFSDFAWGISAGLFAIHFPETSLLKKRSYATAIFLLGVVIFTAICWWIESNGGETKAGAANGFSFNFLGKGLALSGALMIFALYGNSWFNILFSNRLVVYLGKISFALYLCQFVSVGPFVKIGESLFHWFRASLPSEYLGWLAGYIAMSGIAAGLYHFVEHPAQRYLNRRLLSGRTP